MLVGRAALLYHFPELNHTIKDYDYLVTKNCTERPEQINGIRCEYHELPDYLITSEVAPINFLLTLKASHVFWTKDQNIKHFADISFLTSKGAKIDDNLFYTLYNHWQEHYKIKISRSNHNMSPEEFFKDRLIRRIPHDDVHLILNSEPVYLKVLKGDGTVSISEEKFYNVLNEEEQLELIREEIYVLSYERNDYTIEHNAQLYYSKTLRYFVTNLGPIWLAKFVLDNLNRLTTIKYNYLTKINNNAK